MHRFKDVGVNGTVEFTATTSGPHAIFFRTSYHTSPPQLDSPNYPGHISLHVSTPTYNLSSPIKICPSNQSTVCTLFPPYPAASSKAYVVFSAPEEQEPRPGDDQDLVLIPAEVTAEGRREIYLPLQVVTSILLWGTFISVWTTCCCGWSVVDGYRSVSAWLRGGRGTQEERAGLLSARLSHVRVG